MASETPKGPSARLLTMKFMQRAAASAGSSPSTPKPEDAPAAKRRRVSGPPLTGMSDLPSFNRQAVQAALEEEERKRQAALDRQAAESGDTHWVLNVPAPAPGAGAAKTPLHVVQVGFAQIDTGEASEDDTAEAEGPRVSVPAVRRFNMKSKRTHSEANDSEGPDSDAEASHSSDESTGSSADDETGPKRKDRSGEPRRSTSARVRRDAEKARAKELADKRRQKNVKLNKLTSISSAGAQASPNWQARIQCHSCGKTGHKAIDCPQKGKR